MQHYTHTILLFTATLFTITPSQCDVGATTSGSWYGMPDSPPETACKPVFDEAPQPDDESGPVENCAKPPLSPPSSE